MPPRSTLALIRPGQRIQRSRRKGSLLPPGVIYVGRPTLWGNPFTSDRHGHAKSVILHREWIKGYIGALTLERMGLCPAEIAALERKRITLLTRLHELAGRDLACWCPLSSQWCHADTYLQLAPLHAELERLAA